MRLSRKGEYACLAMLELARHYGEGPVRTADICKRYRIPQKYLEQIMIILRHGGYVRSLRGLQGGHRLAKPPARISVADIVRLMDGPLAPVESVSRYFYEHTPVEKSRALLNLFRDIRNYIAAKMENTTFADLIQD
jgi:Rrf2 family protein